jgi:WD40 repeat protein
VAFSPDGKMLATASRPVKLWDACSGVELQTLDQYSEPVNSVAFSPDGKTLALASGYRIVQLWRVRLGVELQSSECHSGWARTVKFSADGKLLASMCEETVKLWDTGSGAMLQVFDNMTKPEYITFCPDSKTLVALNYRTIELYDARSGAVLQKPKSQLEGVSTVAFCPIGKALALASFDGLIELWDVGSGVALQILNGHLEAVGRVVFSPDGKLLASSSFDETVRLWDTESGAALRTLSGRSEWGCTTAFSMDSKMLASAQGAKMNPPTITLWDSSSGVELQIFKGHSEAITAIALSPDNKILASASVDKMVKLWDASSGLELQVLDVDVILRTLSFSDDGTSLQTDKGLLPISLFLPDSTAAVHLQNLPSIFVTGQWVCCYLDRLIWIPPEYRRQKLRFMGTLLALDAHLEELHLWNVLFEDFFSYTYRLAIFCPRVSVFYPH